MQDEIWHQFGIQNYNGNVLSVYSLARMKPFLSICWNRDKKEGMTSSRVFNTRMKPFLSICWNRAKKEVMTSGGDFNARMKPLVCIWSNGDKEKGMANRGDFNARKRPFSLPEETETR